MVGAGSLRKSAPKGSKPSRVGKEAVSIDMAGSSSAERRAGRRLGARKREAAEIYTICIFFHAAAEVNPPSDLALHVSPSKLKFGRPEHRLLWYPSALAVGAIAG